jgi:hypothetical protein
MTFPTRKNAEDPYISIPHQTHRDQVYFAAEDAMKKTEGPTC